MHKHLVKAAPNKPIQQLSMTYRRGDGARISAPLRPPPLPADMFRTGATFRRQRAGKRRDDDLSAAGQRADRNGARAELERMSGSRRGDVYSAA